MSGRGILTTAFLILCTAGYARDIEFTPFYGYAFGGGFEDADTGDEFEIDDSECYGGMLDIRWSEMTQLELFFGRQETELTSNEGLFDGQTVFDLDVDYYHIGGTYLLSNGPWQPFVVGTLGATHLDPGPSGTDSLTRFSMGLGGGLRYLPTEHLGVYVAARGFLTFTGGNTFFRSESGAATIKIDADGLWQGQLQAGLVFAF